MTSLTQMGNLMRVYLKYERGEGGERQRQGGRRGGKGGKQRDIRKKEG